MKKITAVIMLVLMCVFLTGCESEQAKKERESREWREKNLKFDKEFDVNKAISSKPSQQK